MKSIYIICLIVANSISLTVTAGLPKPVVRKIIGEGAAIRIQTEVTLDKHTRPQDVIETCSLLGKENTQLIFEKLEVRRPVIGLFGKYRIGYVKGYL